MEIFEISKTMRQADSEAVAALIAIVQVTGALGRRALQKGRKMEREKRPGNILVERVSTAHLFCMHASP